jgi:hypothetical protein
MTGTPERPLSRQVETDFANFIADRVANNIGQGELRGYDWADDADDDDPYPPIVVFDTETGRRFEVEFEVTATELTEREMNQRAELLEMIKARRTKRAERTV